MVRIALGVEKIFFLGKAWQFFFGSRGLGENLLESVVIVLEVGTLRVRRRRKAIDRSSSARNPTKTKDS